jgi:hypothetical protein
MKKGLSLITAVVGVTLVALAIFLVVRKKKSSEHYVKCIANERGEQVCQDTETVQKLYDQGVLTESSNLPSRGWTKTSPGDINYPTSKGCAWGDSHPTNAWTFWDFTDF